MSTPHVIETNVEIPTAHGRCDAAFIHPAAGSHPGVLVWPDAFGLRPATRDLAQRLAADGYAVLVPNPFYRSPEMSTSAIASLNFHNESDAAALRKLMGAVSAPGAAESDAAAFIAFLDAQPQVDTAKKIGVQGYCMGGALALRTAAVASGRVGAVASFHGGGLVTGRPDSPHTLASKIHARVYIGIASNDDAKQPEAKEVLRAAFAAAKVPAEVEVYHGLHGWCMPDKPVYDKADGERAWAKLLALYKTALA